MTHTALALSPSPRTGPHNTMLRAAEKLGSGLDIGTYGGPCNIALHDLDQDTPPLGSATAGGVLIATPESTHPVPGDPKNALDPASPDSPSAHIERPRGKS
ncbi:hypothetical protein ACFO5K_13405 [Nocardia halotolerans]|uniref:Uncharacterized protein n=1 Tax=Nocardia halotolerans TaxID=1755878 RepID=A0ABV8VK80_9NOCA